MNHKYYENEIKMVSITKLFLKCYKNIYVYDYKKWFQRYKNNYDWLKKNIKNDYKQYIYMIMIEYKKKYKKTNN